MGTEGDEGGTAQGVEGVEQALGRVVEPVGRLVELGHAFAPLAVVVEPVAVVLEPALSVRGGGAARWGVGARGETVDGVVELMFRAEHGGVEVLRRAAGVGELSGFAGGGKKK